jgi:hypothetical protein
LARLVLMVLFTPARKKPPSVRPVRAADTLGGATSGRFRFARYVGVSLYRHARIRVRSAWREEIRMTSSGPRDDKEFLHTRLREVRDAMLWKLEGLSDGDIRRPMTQTATNLLGLVKHLTGMETNWLGDTFGRPATEVPQPWWNDGSWMDGADMYAVPGESTEYIVDLYRRAWAHADRTITELDLDDIGTTPHTGETLTLRQALVTMILETGRHAGHADIVRELIDGAVGGREESAFGATPKSPQGADAAWWREYYNRVAASAVAAEQASNERR